MCGRLFLLLILIESAISTGEAQTPDVHAFCTSVLLNPSSQCGSSQCQGRAGKRGPQGIRGLVGPKGQKGDRGPGTEDLQRRIAELEEKIIADQKTTALDFCALGLKSHKIPDTAINTSSALNRFSWKKWARLDEKPIDGTTSGSWCASSADRSKWITIDLGRMEQVSGIISQGSPSFNFWTTSYTVACGDENRRFKDVTEFGVTKVFKANSDRNTNAVNFFAEKLHCRFVRINPRTWNVEACVRLEIIRGHCSNPQEYKFYVESAGWEDVNTAKVLINGVDHATKSRGHNIVIFNPQTKAISAQGFDTHASASQTNAMVTFLQEAPAYSVISIAVKDSTNGNYMTDEASRLLQTLGAVGTLCKTKIEVRDSWAFITQKVPSNVPRPSWVKCQHVPRYGGKATVHATISISAHYDALENSPIG